MSGTAPEYAHKTGKKSPGALARAGAGHCPEVGSGEINAYPAGFPVMIRSDTAAKSMARSYCDSFSIANDYQ